MPYNGPAPQGEKPSASPAMPPSRFPGKQGPNVKRLIIERMSYLAIPKDGGLADGIALFTTPGKLGDVVRQATTDVEACIAVAKTAVPNPFGNDDEAIAGEILRKIDERKAVKRP